MAMSFCSIKGTPRRSLGLILLCSFLGSSSAFSGIKLLPTRRSHGGISPSTHPTLSAQLGRRRGRVYGEKLRMTATDTEMELLPEDWFEAVDEKTGATYYWNSVSMEVTWSRPQLDALDAVRLKKVAKEKRKKAALARAQTLQKGLEQFEADLAERTKFRSPTKMLSAPPTPPPPQAPQGTSAAQGAKVQLPGFDQPIDLGNLAKFWSVGAQPGIKDVDRRELEEWLAGLESVSRDTSLGGTSKVNVVRGDVSDFSARLGGFRRQSGQTLDIETGRALDPQDATAAPQRPSNPPPPSSSAVAASAAPAVEKQKVEEAKAPKEAGPTMEKQVSELGAMAQGWFTDQTKSVTSFFDTRPKTPAAVDQARSAVAARPDPKPKVKIAKGNWGNKQTSIASVFEYSKAGSRGFDVKINQDTTLVAESFLDDTNLYAVFDGHGENGEVVSQFVAERLPSIILQDCKDAIEAGNGAELKKAIQQAFQDCDQQLQEELEEDYGLQFDGSTGCLVIHKGNSLMVAGLGDSRCVLAHKDGTARAITTDHTPWAERKRIEKAGGEVSAFPDEPRPEQSGKGRIFIPGKAFPGLALSRAFGDLVAKQVGLSYTPDVESIELRDNYDTALIIGSDGLWDVISDQQAAQIVNQFLDTKDSILACSSLVDSARALWEGYRAESQAYGADVSSFSIDDISAVTVFLAKRK